MSARRSGSLGVYQSPVRSESFAVSALAPRRRAAERLVRTVTAAALVMTIGMIRPSSCDQFTVYCPVMTNASLNSPISPRTTHAPARTRITRPELSISTCSLIYLLPQWFADTSVARQPPGRCSRGHRYAVNNFTGDCTPSESDAPVLDSGRPRWDDAATGGAADGPPLG